MRLIRLATAFCVAFVATAAAAQDTSLMTALQRQCMADAQKTCSAEMANPNKVIQCLAKNRAKLKPGCAAVVDRATAPNGPHPAKPKK